MLHFTRYLPINGYMLIKLWEIKKVSSILKNNIEKQNLHNLPVDKFFFSFWKQPLN